MNVPTFILGKIGLVGKMKIDVDFRIFDMFIIMSCMCLFTIIGLFFNYKLCSSDNFHFFLVISYVIGFVAGKIFVRKDSIGLDNLKYGILMSITSAVFIALFVLQNIGQGNFGE